MDLSLPHTPLHTLTIAHVLFLLSLSLIHTTTTSSQPSLPHTLHTLTSTPLAHLSHPLTEAKSNDTSDAGR